MREADASSSAGTFSGGTPDKRAVLSHREWTAAGGAVSICAQQEALRAMQICG